MDFKSILEQIPNGNIDATDNVAIGKVSHEGEAYGVIAVRLNAQTVTRSISSTGKSFVLAKFNTAFGGYRWNGSVSAPLNASQRRKVAKARAEGQDVLTEDDLNALA